MFVSRRAAGRELGQHLQHLRDEHPVVLALPRGGVPVGFEIAESLDAPLDLVLVRKIGAPWQPELAIGAVADGAEPLVLIDDRAVAELGIDDRYIQQETARQIEEIERRRDRYCGDRPPIALADRTAILVDDGIATGSTMRIALRAVRSAGAGRLVLAVPVAPADTVERLRGEADEIVCLVSPTPFLAVGVHYADFAQLADAEVVSLLQLRNYRAGEGVRSGLA